MVLGHSGSGKTTLARALAEIIGGDYVDFAKLKHDDDWNIRPESEYYGLLDAATQPAQWVTDNNGAEMRGLVWPRADTAVMLDYPHWLVFWRLTKRTLRRGILREDFRGNGKLESFWPHLRPSRRSKLYRALANFRERRERLLGHLRDPQFGHLQVMIFTDPRQTDAWVRQLRAAAPPSPSVDSR